MSDLARLVSLKNIFFTQIRVFDLVLLLVCHKQHMAVGEGSVNPPKNLRSRHGHDLGLVIIIDSIDQILIFDDISNVENKFDHSNYL